MANTFFGFDSSANNEGNLLPDDDDDLGEGAEDEYDALNDETFGMLDDSSALNSDWEEQHEQFANNDENSKQSEHIENSIRELVIDSDEDDLLEWPMRSSPDKNGRRGVDYLLESDMPTVEEIEKMVKLFAYTNNSKSRQHQQQIKRQQVQHPSQQQQQRLPPPGFLPQSPQIPLQQRQPPPGLHNPRLPPGFPPCPMPPRPVPGIPGAFPPMGGMMRPGMPLPPGVGPQMPPQYGNFSNFPMPPLPPHLQQQQRMHHHHQQHQNMMQMMQQQQQQQHRQQQQQMQNSRPKQQQQGHLMQQIRDEYADLMTNREKQWLLNIQQLQLNTGTPYFDDYYYTVFKERRARNDKENQPHHQLHLHDRRGHQQRNRNERGENTLTARIYTPLQFENSLGKLQCVSVTAPRKIIDTDVVTLEKDSESTPGRDTRKTKQLLLELESLYSLTLKAEDLLNPVAIVNLEKLIEIKQKQRLREMEAAATAEQKQELLKLLQLESSPPNENPVDYLLKIMSTMLQDDKFASFMNIRKGKMLLLRLLPLLGPDYTIEEYANLWSKVLLCIPLVGRRDMAGDNLFPRLHPYFKRFVQTSRMRDILGIVGKLEQTIRPTDNRCTPLGHQSKAPLHFVVANRFGVSALVTILVRTEYLISSGNVTDEQVDDWLAFVQNWAETTGGRGPIATPIEGIPRPIFIKHINRLQRLGDDKKLLLEKHYVDIN